MARGKPLSAAHKAKIAAGMRSYHRKCRGGGAPTRLVKAKAVANPRKLSAREALKRGGAAVPMVRPKKNMVRGRVSQSNIVTTKRRR